MDSAFRAAVLNANDCSRCGGWVWSIGGAARGFELSWKKRSKPFAMRCVIRRRAWVDWRGFLRGCPRYC